MLRLRADESCLALASSSPRSSPRRPSRTAASLVNARAAWRKDDDATEGGMENDVNAKAYAMRSGVDTAAATHFTTTALRFCRALSAEPQKLQPNRVQRAPASRHFPAIP